MQNNRKEKQFDSNLRKYTRTDRKYRTNKNNNKGGQEEWQYLLKKK